MSRPRADAVLACVLHASALVSGAVVCAIALLLALETGPALSLGSPLRFVADPSWHPTSDRFNLTPIAIGSLLVVLGAVAVAAPLGIASAAFCRFYAPPVVAGVYRRLVELLGGIPSVVFGLWGLVVLVPLIARLQPPGASLLAGVLVLAVMILPIAALVADAAFGSVPAATLQGAAALGLSRYTTIRHVVLPAVRPGLVLGVLLQATRAIGETMVVLMVCGNVAALPASPLDPVRTLTANIALELPYAAGAHRSALFLTGLLLLLGVAGLVLAAELAGRRRAGA